jgi:hypothetical protein
MKGGCKMQKFIQVGITALRDPATGGFLPAVPLYIEATEEAEQSEAAMIKDIGRVFAGKMKQYIDGGGMIERAGARKGKKK